MSEDQWKEAEEAAASAKVREVQLSFGVRQKSRAVQTICDGLATNTFITHIALWNVPEEMKESVKHTLKTVTYVDVD